MFFTGHKTDSSVNLSKSACYPSRNSKSSLRLAGLTSKSSNGRNCHTVSGESIYDKADSYDSVTFSCGDDDESNSSEAPRRSGPSRNRRHQKTHL